MSKQTNHYLRTEELYKKVVETADHEAQVCQVGLDETKLRGILDAILTQGKIEARVLALQREGYSIPEIARDRLVERWQRIVDSV